MKCTTCLFVNVNSVTAFIKTIGSLSGHMDLALQPCFVEVPAVSTFIDVHFFQIKMLIAIYIS